MKSRIVRPMLVMITAALLFTLTFMAAVST
jgi:hypothetical protein